MESPEDCLIREVREETGYELCDFDFRGIVTFVYGKRGEEVVEYMHLFVGRNVVGEPIECNEGILKWVDKKEVLNLNLWEGDKIFLKLLEEREEFFSLKLVYTEDEKLSEVFLDGKLQNVKNG
jgi:isopentenyldiphosphate isomerase